MTDGRCNDRCAFEASRDELSATLRRIERNIEEVKGDLRVGQVHFSTLSALPPRVEANARHIALQQAETSRLARIVYGICGVVLFSVIGAIVTAVLK
jgi:hypothetical protein